MGSLTISEVLDKSDTNEIISRTKVLAVLESMPKIGKVKARRIMKDIGIAESRRLRGLGDQQRAALSQSSVKYWHGYCSLRSRGSRQGNYRRIAY